jgi:hypothetical protein
MSTINTHKQWILTEAVKSSGRLANGGNITLEHMYDSIETWYDKKPLIRFKHRLVKAKNFLGGLLRVLFRG